MAASFCLMPITRGAAAGAPTKLNDNPAAASVDIAGIRIGMTPEQVRAALRAHAPRAEVHEQLVVIEDYPGSEHVAELSVGVYARGLPDETILVQFTQPPSARRVMRVVRHVGFTYRREDAPGAAKTTAAVQQKYGKPSYASTTGYGSSKSSAFMWSWTPQGQRKDLSRSRDCDEMAMKHLREKGAADFGASRDDDKALKAGCALTLVVEVAEDSGFVVQIGSVLVDLAMASDGIALTAARVEALQRDAQSTARERAAKQKPSL